MNVIQKQGLYQLAIDSIFTLIQWSFIAAGIVQLDIDSYLKILLSIVLGLVNGLKQRSYERFEKSLEQGEANNGVGIEMILAVIAIMIFYVIYCSTIHYLNPEGKELWLEAGMLFFIMRGTQYMAKNIGV